MDFSSTDWRRGFRATSEQEQGTLLPNCYYASRDLPRGESDCILKMVKKELAEIFPESAVATMFRGKVVTDPNAVFSMAPGTDSSRLHTDACAEHRIWLAGDWTQTGWPATMEGALRSGACAAEELLLTFGRPARIIEKSSHSNE